MILPDLNVLLYAYNPHVEQHGAARAWWEKALNAEELIGLPHEVAFGFIRIATHPRLGAARVPLARAGEVVEMWLSRPNVRLLLPGPGHFEQVMELMRKARAAGAVVSDAILAAYAIHHRAILQTNDGDFSRFPGLQWNNPLMDASPPDQI